MSFKYELTPGSTLIAQERLRQIEVEGYMSDDDARWANDELAIAAALYALPTRYGHMMDFWPWGKESFKKYQHSRIRQLVIAGALIAAEIDRLQQVGEKP